MESPSITDFIVGVAIGVIFRDLIIAVAKYGLKKALELQESAVKELERKI